MELFALCQGLSFISQKSHQNHQSNMLAEAGTTLIKAIALGAVAYLGGKCIESFSPKK